MTVTIINLPAPPSSNNMFMNVKGRGRVRTAEYNAWIRAAVLMISFQRAKPVPSPVSIVLRVGKINAASDLSNRLKAAEDVLVKNGIITNDSVTHVHSITAEKAFGKVKDGWVEIVVTHIAEEAAA